MHPPASGGQICQPPFSNRFLGFLCTGKHTRSGTHWQPQKYNKERLQLDVIQHWTMTCKPTLQTLKVHTVLTKHLHTHTKTTKNISVTKHRGEKKKESASPKAAANHSKHGDSRSPSGFSTGLFQTLVPHWKGKTSLHRAWEDAV